MNLSIGDSLLYPAFMPEALKDVPDLFDGKVASASRMFLAVREDERGIKQCDTVIELLADEMMNGPKGVTCENFVKLKKIVSEATEWHSETCKDDKIVNLKLDFLWQLEFCAFYVAKNAYCDDKSKNPYDVDQPVRMLVQASYLVKTLREIIEKQIKAKKAEALNNA